MNKLPKCEKKSRQNNSRLKVSLMTSQMGSSEDVYFGNELGGLYIAASNKPLIPIKSSKRRLSFLSKNKKVRKLFIK